MTTPGQIDAYFSHLVSKLCRRNDVSIVAVAHMVSNTVQFAPALDNLATLTCILAKHPSAFSRERETIEQRFKVSALLTREWASDSDNVVSFLYEHGLRQRKVVIVDIGGYFSESIDKVAEKFDGVIIGVLEGTENGVKRYESSLRGRVPVVTVARSPLKLPEDYLVGSSIVYSIEAVLRDNAEILQTRSATVIGYGRVGSSIAEILRNRGISTGVHDVSPVKLAEAAAKGFSAFRMLGKALERSSLVVCATGNKALDIRGFALLKDGCVVASVTSSDDEFDLQSLGAGYRREQVAPHLTRYQEVHAGDVVRSFYLIADGNGANFLHGAVIGPAIQLIEGEKLAAIQMLIDGEISVGSVCEVSNRLREAVATVWNDHFLSY